MTDTDIGHTAAFKSALAANEAAFEKFRSYLTGEPHTDDEFRRTFLALRESLAILKEFCLVDRLQGLHPDIPLDTIVRIVGEDRGGVQQ